MNHKRWLAIVIKCNAYRPGRCIGNYLYETHVDAICTEDPYSIVSVFVIADCAEHCYVGTLNRRVTCKVCWCTTKAFTIREQIPQHFTK